jgi:hypothetical protein
MEQPTCDFCGSLETAKAYEVVNIETEMEPPGGIWLACGACAALIGSEDREGLRDRAVLALLDRHGPHCTFAGALRSATEVQRAFWVGIGDPRSRSVDRG